MKSRNGHEAQMDDITDKDIKSQLGKNRTSEKIYEKEMKKRMPHTQKKHLWKDENNGEGSVI
jgi:hypothetical protein